MISTAYLLLILASWRILKKNKQKERKKICYFIFEVASLQGEVVNSPWVGTNIPSLVTMCKGCCSDQTLFRTHFFWALTFLNPSRGLYFSKREWKLWCSGLRLHQHFCEQTLDQSRVGSEHEKCQYLFYKSFCGASDWPALWCTITWKSVSNQC